LALNHPKAPFLLYEASLLIEAGRMADFAGIIVVTAPHPIRVDRVMTRDSLGADAVNRMVQAQLSDEDRAKHATHTIENRGSLDDLRAQVRKVLDQIKPA
jgi:dephospho-CoA kinase